MPYTGTSPGEAPAERWGPWPVNWSGVWIGALAALAAVVVFGLIGVAVGAQTIDPTQRLLDLRDSKQLGTLAVWCSVFSAFLAFVIGGWASARVTGVYHAENGMLQGAVSWLVALPVLAVLMALGAGGFMGGWYGGLAGRPAWAGASEAPYHAPWDPGATASDEARAKYQKDLAKYRENVDDWRDPEKAARATRNTALTAITALLLGLVGSVIGGWMASGEPMTFTYKRATGDNEAPVRV